MLHKEAPFLVVCENVDENFLSAANDLFITTDGAIMYHCNWGQVRPLWFSERTSVYEI